MIRTVLHWLGVYLIAMLIASGLSFLFSTDSPGEHQVEAQTITVESEQEETVSSVESTEPVKTNPSDSQPFDFSVNVITEADESNTRILLPRPIPKTEPPNPLGTLLEELEKRKNYFIRICMRKFCNRIRR
jgi:hypothetical protein